jgi:hypothetical protein
MFGLWGYRFSMRSNIIRIAAMNMNERASIRIVGEGE